MVVINGSFLFCFTLKGGSTSFLRLFDEAMGTKGTTHAAVFPKAASAGNSCRASDILSGDLRDSLMRHTPNAPLPACAVTLAGLVSTTVVRNPWDRVASAYESKLGGCDRCHFSKGAPFAERSKKERACGKCVQFAPFVARPQGTRSFADFVRAWVMEHADEDEHTKRCSTRCRPASFPYTKVIRLEDGLFAGFASVLADAAASTAARVGSDRPDVSRLSRWAAAATKLVGGKRANCKINCNSGNTRSDVDEAAATALRRRRRMYVTSDAKDGLRHPHELVDIIARVYADDIAMFNYSFEAY